MLKYFDSFSSNLTFVRYSDFGLPLKWDVFLVPRLRRFYHLFLLLMLELLYSKVNFTYVGLNMQLILKVIHRIIMS